MHEKVGERKIQDDFQGKYTGFLTRSKLKLQLVATYENYYTDVTYWQSMLLLYPT